MKNTFTVVFASDARGAIQLGVALYSLLATAGGKTKYHVYVLDDGIAADDKAKMEALHGEFDFELSFVPLSETLVKYSAREYSSWPAAALGRLFVSSLLPSSEPMALYCDIDILFTRDLMPLKMDMGDSLLGAVYERPSAGDAERLKKLGMPPGSAYFNSGVLLMNLEGMREEGAEEALVDFFRKNGDRISYPDQDVLNAVLGSRTFRLAPEWNWVDSQSRKFRRGKRADGAWWGGMGYEAALKAALDPAIIHFTGQPKPVYPNHRFNRRLYESFLNQSPWKDSRPPGKAGMKQWFKRLLYVPLDAAAKRRILREAREIAS